MSAVIETWRDRLTTASWRGTAFLTESHDAKLGRRLVAHEFPGADLPFIEDLGGKFSELRVNAYFLGPNYDIYRNNFLFLLQQTGPEWLDHPWLGRIQVQAKDWTVTENNEKGGYCTVSIDFIAAGAMPTTAIIDLVDDAVDKLLTLDSLSEDTFSLLKMGSDAVNSFIAQVSGVLDTLRTVISIAQMPITWVRQITSQIQGIKGDFADLLAIPGQFDSALGSLFGSILGADVDLSDTDKPRVVAQLTQLATRYPINGTLLNMSVSSTSALELPINIEKQKALQAMFLVSVAGQIALTDYNDSDTRDAVLASVLSAIDTLVPQLPDPIFQAAIAARVALIGALMAQNLEPAQSYDIINYMPAVVLAWRLEQDELVFEAMNGVTHPLFVRGIVYG